MCSWVLFDDPGYLLTKPCYWNWVFLGFARLDRFNNDNDKKKRKRRRESFSGKTSNDSLSLFFFYTCSSPSTFMMLTASNRQTCCLTTRDGLLGQIFFIRFPSVKTQMYQEAPGCVYYLRAESDFTKHEIYSKDIYTPVMLWIWSVFHGENIPNKTWSGNSLHLSFKLQKDSTKPTEWMKVKKLHVVKRMIRMIFSDQSDVTEVIHSSFVPAGGESGRTEATNMMCMKHLWFASHFGRNQFLL